MFADAIRATAIFAVVLHHLVYVTGPSIGHQRPYVLGYLGVWGVNCFFVLSGYLLGRPYLAALIDPNKPFPSTRLFLSRRFLRIYPLYAVALVFSVIAVALQTRLLPSLYDVVAHFLMLHTLTADTANSINGPLWTMAVDAEFYVALPIAALVVSRLFAHLKREQRVRALWALLGTTVVLSTAYRLVQLLLHPDAVRNFAEAVVDVRNVFGFAATFTFGLMLGLIALLYGHSLRVRPLFQKCLVVTGVLIALSQLTVRVQEPVGPVGTGTLLRLTFMEPLAALSVSLILFGLGEGAFPTLTRFAHTSFVARAAVLAYAVYLFHFPIVEGVSRLLHTPRGNGAFLLVTVISLALVLPIAFLAHHFLESPFLRLKDKLREQGTSPVS